MNAFGRLWDRAPIWRRAMYLTCAAVAMTALYPPSWIGGVTPAVHQRAADVVPSGAPDVGQASSAPTTPVPGEAPKGGENLPVPGEFYSGRLPFGSQSVPLPPGHWLALARQTGVTPAGPGASVFLALELGGRLVAAASITGSTVSDPKATGYPAPLEAQIPHFYYRRVFSAVDHGAVDLWLTGTTAPAKWNDAYRQAAISAVQKQSIPVPDQFVTALFRLADKRNWLSAEFMFANSGGDQGSVRSWTEVAALPETAGVPFIEKVRRWGKAWHAVMRRGFAGGAWSADEARIALP